jgi:hypothetical protein
MPDRRTLIDRSGLRELFRWEKQRPDGVWETLFQGFEYVLLKDGTEKRGPQDMFFKSEAEGRAWLKDKKL